MAVAAWSKGGLTRDIKVGSAAAEESRAYKISCRTEVIMQVYLFIMYEAGEQRTLWLNQCSEFEAFEEFVRPEISRRDKSFTLWTLILDSIHAPSRL